MNTVPWSDELLAEHSGSMHRIVDGILRRLPKSTDSAPLWNAALFGLYTATLRYDAANNNCNFRTYAAYRIKGEIFDELRRQCWSRSRFKPIVVELEEPDTFPAEDSSPAEITERLDLLHLLAKHISTLRSNEAYAMERIFYHSAQDTDVAMELNLSASRVCQLKVSALRKLRRTFNRLLSLNSQCVQNQTCA